MEIIPQVIMPMFGDQPFWAATVCALGIGTSVPATEPSAERLASALVEADQPSMRARAERLAQRIAVDGAAVAARLLAELA